MVSAFDFRSSSPDWFLAGDIALCSWARHFTLTVSLPTQVHNWVTANVILRVTLRWTSIPSRGSRNATSRFMPQKPGLLPAWWAAWLVYRLYLTYVAPASALVSLIKKTSLSRPLTLSAWCGVHPVLGHFWAGVFWETLWLNSKCTSLQINRGFGPGSLWCVLGQNTLLSLCLSPPRCINGYQQTITAIWKMPGGPSDGQASHPGGGGSNTEYS